MESAPSKRRKTSYTTSAPIDAATTPSPTRPRREGARTTPRRASFLSPTKASIARFNPELIARPQSASSGDGRFRNPRDGGLDPRRRLLSPAKSSVNSASQTGGETNSQSTRSSIAPPSEVNRNPILQERTPAPSMDVEVASPTRRMIPTVGLEGLRATPRRPRASDRLFSPSKDHNDVHSSTRGASGVLGRVEIANAPFQSPSSSGRRRSTRLAGAQSGQSATTRQDIDKRREVDHVVDDGEPDLPPLDPRFTQLETVANRSPLGLLSSPSRRPNKRRDRKGDVSSMGNEPQPARSGGADVDSVSGGEKAFTEPEVRPDVMGDEETRLDEGVKARRDEETALEDVDILRDEETAHEETTTTTGKQLMFTLRELEAEVKDLERQVAAARDAAMRDKPRPLSLQQGKHEEYQPSTFSLNAFLPFSRHRRLVVASSLNKKTKAARTSKTTAKSSIFDPEDPPIPSHSPIDLEDPLPYLQVFTPLTFTSTVTTTTKPRYKPPAPVGAAPATATSGGNRSLQCQEHTVKASSPSKFLTATISMKVDPASHRITSLMIPSLSPWAELELGRWIRDRAATTGPAGKDVTSICHAMARYWILAKRRVGFWMDCQEEFPGLVHNTGHSIIKGMTGRVSVAGRSSRGGQEDVPGDGEVDEQGITNDPSHQSHHPWNHDRSKNRRRRDLSRHLGRSSLSFRRKGRGAGTGAAGGGTGRDRGGRSEKGERAGEGGGGGGGRSGVQLMISWDISFDWTGEAQSRISATASLPHACKSWNTPSFLKPINCNCNCTLDLMNQSINSQPTNQTQIDSLFFLFQKEKHSYIFLRKFPFHTSKHQKSLFPPPPSLRLTFHSSISFKANNDDNDDTDSLTY